MRRVVGVIIALLPVSVYAQTGDGSGGFFVRDYAEITSVPASQPWWALTFDLVIKLGLVIGLIYLTMWALRRYVAGPRARARAGGGAGLGRINVLDSVALGPGRNIYLLSVAQRVLVVGATSSSLATLGEISDPADVEALRLAPPATEPPDFADQLRSFTENSPTFIQDKIGELRALAAQFRRTQPGESS
ncbi:MAG: hypothetical protein EPO26_02905 [Chloroflexota bacterium]|nr:MAG: hypothetical protein EPO26_02905 [Chloroflexota bacterium]